MRNEHIKIVVSGVTKYSTSFIFDILYIMVILLVLLVFMCTCIIVYLVAISDDTELVDDVGTGGSAVVSSALEAEPLPVVERTEDSRRTSAEVPHEVSDETEIETEPEEKLRDPVSPATTSAGWYYFDCILSFL